MRAGTERIGVVQPPRAGPAAQIAIALALGLGLPAAAHAQPSPAAAATLQFDKGRALMKQKRYAEACAAFQHSQKLDPQLGTLYNLGVCYAQLGKIASAWSAYREVGQRDTNPNRKREANRRAKQLEKRLPKLLLTIASPPPGLAVTMNGADVTAFLGADTPVDPAEYKLKATAPGHAAWEATAKADAGKTVTLAIELARPAAREPVKRPPPPVAEPRRPPAGDARALGASAPAPPEDAEPSGPDAPPGGAAPQRRKRIALVVGIGGAASLATGLVFGALARGKWADARALCGGDAICDDPATLAQGNALVDEARRRATWSTGLVIGGAALVGAAAVLWLTAPPPASASDTAIRIAPQLGPGHAALTLGGRFR